MEMNEPKDELIKKIDKFIEKNTPHKNTLNNGRLPYSPDEESHRNAEKMTRSPSSPMKKITDFFKSNDSENDSSEPSDSELTSAVNRQFAKALKASVIQICALEIQDAQKKERLIKQIKALEKNVKYTFNKSPEDTAELNTLLQTCLALIDKNELLECNKTTGVIFKK